MVFPLTFSNFLRILMAFGTLPCETSHLADSGTNHGVNMANAKGAEVTIANNFQSAKYKAIHGSAQEAIVKKIAIDMFATNVRHFGPTYSSTENKNKYLIHNL